MDIVGIGKRVQVFVDEGDHRQGKSLFQTILEKLHAEGAAGATVTRGIAGFGAHSRIHTARLADVLVSLPVVITWIDAPDRVERLLPMICELVGEGLVTVEDVNIVKYTHRDLAAMQQAMTVGEVMTRDVEAVQPDTPLADVVDRLIDQDFRALPVAADGRLVGIITNGDLVERGGLPARVELLQVLGPEARHQALAAARSHTARDVMTPDPATIGPDAPLARAVELMLHRGLKRLPVVGAGGRLVGMISRVDLLGALGESYPAPEEQGSGLAAPVIVGDVMSRHVPVVREDARLAEVLDAVVSTRLNRAVVIDRAGRVQGVVSDADVLRRLEPHAHAGVLGALMRRSRMVPDEAARATAAEMMRAPAVTVAPDTPIGEAARRMVETRRKILPVVDAQGLLLGIVDRAHLLAAAGRQDADFR